MSDKFHCMTEESAISRKTFVIRPHHEIIVMGWPLMVEDCRDGLVPAGSHSNCNTGALISLMKRRIDTGGEGLGGGARSQPH